MFISEHIRTAAAAEATVAEIGIRLLDDAYLAWLMAQNEAHEAFRSWGGAPRGAGRSAFCAYRAALDREEAAARDLQRLSELTGRAEAMS